MKYRPEIDGLRALAVVPVILSHAGLGVFHGGFVGVDVFFVISGFLITGILLDEQSTGRFSLLGFYERRARRILPALFLVMACCVPLSWWMMLPEELQNFGQSLVATVAFANNVLLTLTSGYWSLASEFKPLLHTWSLGVEEQFYVLFPLMLLALQRVGARVLLGWLLGVALLSLLLAEVGSVRHPTGAFYLLPTRAWELLLGSVAAVALREGWLQGASPRVQQVGGLLGLVGIVASVCLFGPETPSPSLWLLVPTLGAVAIVLFARPGTWSHAVLASRPMVAIGLISYSAYLWHQPLFAFARVASREQPSMGLMLGLCVLSLLLARLSWQWVEQPMRRAGGVDRKTVFGGALVGSAAFAAVGVYLHLAQGLPQRLNGPGAEHQTGQHVSYNERIHGHRADAFPSTAKVKVLVQGNSYARDFVNMNLEVFDTRDLAFVYRDDFLSCIDEASDVMRRLYDQADVVVFASGDPRAGCVASNIDLARRAGKQLFYVGSKHFGYNLNWLVRLKPSERVLQANSVMPVYRQEEETLRGKVPPAHFLPIYDRVLLADGRMPVTDERGRLLTPDRVHLTQAGAVYVGQRVLWGSAYERALGSPPRRAADGGGAVQSVSAAGAAGRVR